MRTTHDDVRKLADALHTAVNLGLGQHMRLGQIIANAVGDTFHPENHQLVETIQRWCRTFADRHVFVGRTDRWCERCHQPDRADVHRV